MRLFIIMLVAALLQVSTSGFSQTVSFSGKDVPLKTVFSAVKKQTGYVFFYDAELLRQVGPVTVQVKEVSLDELLKACLKGTALEYAIKNKTVFITKAAEVPPGLVRSTGLLVTGTVTDSVGAPLGGATISVRGSRLSAVSDDAGQFAVKAFAGDMLAVSYIGYHAYLTKIDTETTLQIVLKRTPVALQEVAVVSTGYQTLSKERAVGSFAKPDMQIVNNRSTSMNILQRLDGLIPGLTINNASSASNNPILIRGLTSITGNKNPLYVVDGIPMDDVSTINPQDVADITVLKDATAASIWGARAANGVIVIVTKKGGTNEKIKVQYDGFMNFLGRPDLHYIPVLNSRQFIQAAKDVFDPVSYSWNTVSAYSSLSSKGVAPHEMILYNQSRGIISAAQANASLDSLASINNVQQISDLMYRNASLMNHTISLSGGGKAHSFYGSIAYTNTQSNRPGEENKSYKINVRQDFTFNKSIQLYLITDLTNTRTAAKRTIDNIDNRFYPYQLFKDANGNNLSMPYMGYLSDSTRIAYQNRSRINLDYNPLDEFNYGYTKGDALRNRIIAGTTVKLFNGLRFEGVYGYIKNASKTTDYDDAKSYLVRSELVQFTVAPTPASTPVYYLPTTGGRYTIVNGSQSNWTVRNQLIYDKAWNNRLHQLTVLAGQEAQNQITVNNRSTVRGYNEQLQTYASIDYATLGSTGVTGTVMTNRGASILRNDAFSNVEQQTRFTSYYANGGYTYNRKYSINGSWRIDQSNLFGTDKSAQNKPVWSVGSKWMMSEEQFMTDLTWINRLAVRATYGITGNAPSPGTASSFDVMSAQSNAVLPGGTGLAIATPANRELVWESTKTMNIGVDFSVLNSRLSGSLDLYQKKTDNLIGTLPTNNFTGYASITGNFGNLQNKGVELSLNSLNITKKNFSWNTLFTLSYNKNTITQLNSVVSITTGAQKIAQSYLTDYPAFALFAYQYAGLDNLGDPMIRLADKTTTKARNVATPGDVVFMGSYQPAWNGGISNSFSYKGFGLSINAVYNLGYVMRRDANDFYTSRLTHGAGISTLSGNSNSGFAAANVNAEFDNRWRKPGDEAFTLVPSYVSNSSISATRRDVSYYTNADINVVSASYIKLRDITLTYSLPKTLISRIKTDNITFRAQLSNLMLWKANKYGIDPEFQNAYYGYRAIPISNQGTVTVGVHVTF